MRLLLPLGSLVLLFGYGYLGLHRLVPLKSFPWCVKVWFGLVWFGCSSVLIVVMLSSLAFSSSSVGVVPFFVHTV